MQNAPLRGPGGAPRGGLWDPRRGFRYGPGTDWGGTKATLYACFGSFKHILTDFDFPRFLHTPFINASLDRCKSSEMSLTFPDFAQNLAKSGKNLRNIPRLLEALHGCTEIGKIQNHSLNHALKSVNGEKTIKVQFLVHFRKI